MFEKLGGLFMALFSGIAAVFSFKTFKLMREYTHRGGWRTYDEQVRAERKYEKWCEANKKKQISAPKNEES